MKKNFSEKLIRWYSESKRPLPWRDHPDPYWIWVSEIMAQQTRLDTVVPYFLRWVERFPTIAKLSEASEQEVLKLWEGLGYYSRGRNIHLSAIKIMNEFGGKLPEDIKTLKSLPGIGPYTAGAIASMAFGKDEAVVDGNVKRVLSRIFNVREEVNTGQGEKIIWALAQENLPSGKAGDYNQGLMSLGASLCSPRKPDCEICPISTFCEAKRLGLQAELPRMKAKPKVPHYIVTAAVIQEQNKFMITQRPPGGMLAGLWEFPGGKLENGESLEMCLKREIKEELDIDIRVNEEVGIYKHAYTHFKVTLHAFHCQKIKGEPKTIEVSAINWVELSALEDFPMGKIDRLISETLAKESEANNGA